MLNIITLFEHNTFFRLGILILFGLIIGSFLNVVIHRFPVMLKSAWLEDNFGCNDDELIGDEFDSDYKGSPIKRSSYNLWYPPSHCPRCMSKIPYWANIPILGYFFAKGLCVECKKPISKQYLLVEALTAVLFMFAGIIFYDSLVLLCYLIFISFVVCLIFIDFNTFFLPNHLTLSLLWLGLILNTKGIINSSLSDAVWGAVVGYSSLWLLCFIFRTITKKDGMGYGDFKFSAAMLAWFGCNAVIPLFLIASVLAIICFTILRLLKKISFSQPLAFGPFLGIAGLTILYTNNTLAFHLW